MLSPKDIRTFEAYWSGNLQGVLWQKKASNAVAVGQHYVNLGVGLDDPYGSLQTQDMLCCYVTLCCVVLCYV